MNIHVSIIIPVYNQERFVRQCLESVFAQKTNYQFEVLVGDDFSNDSTYNICLDFMNRYSCKMRLFRYESNIGLMKNYDFLLSQVRGKYIAIIEGDDYWVDDQKIDDQVSFMEKYSEYGLIHSDVHYFYEDYKKFVHSYNKRFYRGISSGFVFDDLIERNYVRPQTILVRTEIVKRYVNSKSYIEAGFKTFDYPFLLDISRHVKFYYQDKVYAVYRVHGGSISNNTHDYTALSGFIESMYDIKSYYLNKISDGSANEIFMGLWKDLYYAALSCGASKEAKINFKKMKERRGFDYIFFFFLFLPYSSRFIRLSFSVGAFVKANLRS